MAKFESREEEEGKICKQCGDTNKYGRRNFCSKKCRKLWQREHSIKGAKKFYANPDNWISGWGLTSSACDKNSHYPIPE